MALLAKYPSRASERIVASVEREIAVRKKEILSSKVGGAKVQEFKQQLKINAANKDYGKVLKALRISETQRANNLKRDSYQLRNFRKF